MISKSKISLNRIISPGLTLEEFFKFTSDMGLNKVELRNDLPGIGIIDPYLPDQVKELSETYDIDILTVNALQRFNKGAVLPDILAELKELIALSVSIGCKAIVLVPSNDENDKRHSKTIFKETVAALKTFDPFFKESGIFGYVEPLGFKECSLRSKVTAMQAIQESECRNYKIIYDTFHHHLGPDSAETLENEYDIFYTGLVHLSGVAGDIPANQYKDDHRILITSEDRLQNLEQIELLIKKGYQGNFSFEPFAGAVQSMEIEALNAAINRSIDLILSGKTNGSSMPTRQSDL